MAEDYKLIDNEEKHRYEFQIDGKIAEIDYIKSNNGEIYLVHTCLLYTSVEVLNLMDKNYEIVKYFPMPGRSVRATIKIRY